MKNLFRIKVIGAILFCGLMISFKNASADTTKVSLTKQERAKIISEAKKCKADKDELQKDEKLKETSPYAGEQQRAIRTCKKWVKSLEN